MIILGLNSFHDDSAAALIRDGKLIAALEEERFRRISTGPVSRRKRSPIVCATRA